jgi:hypothetical protein
MAESPVVLFGKNFKCGNRIDLHILILLNRSHHRCFFADVVFDEIGAVFNFGNLDHPEEQ